MWTDQPNEPRDRSDRAEYWQQRRSARDFSPREQAEFERWYAENPEHEAAYERAEYLYRRAEDLRLDPYWTAAAQAAKQSAGRMGMVRRVARAGSVALVLAISIGIGWQQWNPVEPQQHYATAVGERRTVELQDGSSVVLDTNSALNVQFSRKRRDLTLERGRAQFSVAADKSRPFIVAAGNGTVRAVGTEFQVRSDGRNVLVTLLEGIVTVTAPSRTQDGEATATLAAGEQLSFDGQQLWAKSAADLAVAEGWTRGELVFNRRPLRELIDEMNRYTSVQLKLADPSLGNLPVSGAFYDNDQDSLIQALEVGWSLRAERNGSEIRLHPANNK